MRIVNQGKIGVVRFHKQLRIREAYPLNPSSKPLFCDAFDP